MKFDMGRAWNDAIAMASKNKDVLVILGAVFFFLPSLMLTLFVPMTEFEAAAQDPDRMQALIPQFIANYGVYFVIYLIISVIGSLAVLALLGNDSRPTVGEAIKIGAAAFLPNLLAQIIVGIAVMLLVVLLIGLPAAIHPALGVIGGIAAVAIAAFVAIRLILVSPVMAIERTFNPIAALSRSWSLIKGNTRYVFAFLLLLIVALIVVSTVVSLIVGLFAALLGGGTLSLWFEGILSGLIGAVLSIIMLAVYAAIYAQLAGPGTAQVSEPFE